MEDPALEKRPTHIESGYRVIQINELSKDQTHLILSKWLRSLKFTNDFFKLIDSPAYFSHYGKFVQTVLNRPNVIVRMAVLSDDLDVVLGFSVSEGDCLHYIHVHKDQRGLGIGTSLLPKEFNQFSHLTKIAIKLWPKYPHLKFNPFA